MGLGLFVMYRGSSCALYPELLQASSLLVVCCECFVWHELSYNVRIVGFPSNS